MRYARFLPFVVLAISTSFVQPAHAIKQFYDEWVVEYLDKNSDQAYVDHVKKDVKCFICHQGKDRKHRNAYGAELAKLLNKKTDAKDKDKMLAAFKQVAEMKVDPNDPKSETFGDRIKAGKLPGGELDDLKKDPAE